MPSSTPRPWSPDEDSLLKLAVAEYGDEPGMWKTIATRVPGRSNKACRKRWLHSLSPTIKKTPWTPDEDATLLRLYSSHNPPRWSLIAKHIPGRTDDACSKRYREALDPQLKRDQWTPDEDARLLELTLQLGSKWTQVGQAMGRSGLGCRNRWRLLERKRPRDPPASQPSFASPFLQTITPRLPPADPVFSPPELSPFGDESNASQDPHVSLGNTIARSFIPDPPPGQISTSSSLSGALASSAPQVPSLQHAPPEPEPPSQPHSSPDLNNKLDDDVISIEDYSESTRPPTISPTIIVPPRTPSVDGRLNESFQRSISAAPDENPDAATSLRTHGRPLSEDAETSPKPRKRPRLRGSPSAAQDSPRLSSHLPATMDRTVLPYACGHAECWPGGAARFATASEVAEHRRLAHPDPDAGKLFRCGLEGCGKGWKNINGIQYHLQISKAHFQAALSQTRASSDPVLTPRDVPAKKTTQKKEHRCPHEGCPNTYKQRTGLQYHLTHGHPTNVAQLEVIPPGLMRKIGVESASSGPADQ